MGLVERLGGRAGGVRLSTQDRLSKLREVNMLTADIQVSFSLIFSL